MTNPTHVCLKNEKAHFDLGGRTSYGDYLQLDQILGAQLCRSDVHDEHFFIVIHQISELWLSIILHELDVGLMLVQKDQLGPVLKILSRVSKAEEQLRSLWDVVSTLTPTDYLRFRDALGEASGFQSYQYRMLEFALGNKNAKLAEVFAHTPPIYARVQDRLNSPSLYDETLRLLKRRGFELPATTVDRDWSQPYRPDDAVVAAWREVYLNTDVHWDLYEFAEKLIDVEDQFQRWRFLHFKSVERLIGHRIGTGGTSGASYLKKALDLRFFPELYTVRTEL
jgi:tryptophan 2,3-dioxygenase